MESLFLNLVSVMTLAILLEFNFGLKYLFLPLFLFSILIFVFDKKWIWAFAGVFLILVSFLLNSVSKNTVPIGENLKIEGKVIGAGIKDQDYQKIEVKTNKINGKKVKYIISIDNFSTEELKKGEFVKGEIKTKEIQGYNNFLQFNLKKYYKTKNIYNAAKTTDLKKTNKIGLLDKISINSVSYINNLLDKNLSKDVSGIMKKLLLADSKYIENEFSKNYSEAGISHVFAISGMHIYLIIFILNFLFLKLGLGYNLRLSLVGIFLIFYGFILNFPASVSRAVLMFFIAEISEIMKIKLNKFDILFLSMAIILFLKPYSIYDVGFQFSYLSVFGIFIFYDKIHISDENILSSGIKAYFSVNIMILPLLIYYFNNFNPISFFTNLFFVPVISFVLIFAFLGIFFSFFSSKAAGIIFFLINIIMKAFNFYLENILSIFNFKIRFLFPNIFLIIFYYMILFMLLDKSTLKIVKKNMRVLYLIFLSFLIITAFENREEKLIAGFYDVGQGDSSYILYKDKYIQIDTGGNQYSKNNPGVEVTAKSILKRGIPQVNLLILSHFDADHVMGTEKLLEENLVKKILINRKEEISDVYKKIVESNVDYVTAENIEKIIVDKDLSLKIFNQKDILYEESNDSSIVVLAEYKNNKILYTGDITEKVERKIKDKIGNVDILKVSHHGSKYGTSEEFIKAVKPTYSVISVGKNNPYGHPKKRVLKTLKENNSKILRTDLSGEIIFEIGKDIKYVTYNGYKIDYYKIAFDFLYAIILILNLKLYKEGEHEIH